MSDHEPATVKPVNHNDSPVFFFTFFVPAVWEESTNLFTHGRCNPSSVSSCCPGNSPSSFRLGPLWALLGQTGLWLSLKHFFTYTCTLFYSLQHFLWACAHAYVPSLPVFLVVCPRGNRDNLLPLSYAGEQHWWRSRVNSSSVRLWSFNTQTHAHTHLPPHNDTNTKWHNLMKFCSLKQVAVWGEAGVGGPRTSRLLQLICFFE